jgi:plastocyanin
MKNWLTVLGACLTLGVAAAGCGSDDSSSDDSGGSAATTEQPAKTSASGGAAAKTAAVEMKDISFQPGDVTVATGGTVTWTNDDSADHDVTADDGSFKSGDAGGLSGGDTFKHTFDKAGSFKYVCTVHPGMEGTVTVK